MPSELLKCIICPKKPKFSDVSHLLTHVGSKGHLSHLHGLQVRSVEELDAGHQVALYNQWCQEHGMSARLSERMQQKEQKRALKRAANAARMANTPMIGKIRKPVFKSIQNISSSTLLEGSCTPVRKQRDSSYPALNSTPPGLTSEEATSDFLFADADVDAKASPGTPQLKGTQYPGMDLFDAAPEEQRRMRNQKKDSSVLRKLEVYSSMVVPRETVTSAAGEVLKHRHMDDLENDSPVEGEEMLRKPTPKRRKYTKPRAPRIKKEKVERKLDMPKRRPGRPRKVLQTPSKDSEISADEDEPSNLALTPIDVESKEYVANTIRLQKRSTFAVYQDSSPAFGVDGSSDDPPHAYADVNGSEQQFAYPPTLWQRSEPDPYDPFKLIRERFSSNYTGFEDLGRGKENSTSLHNVGIPQTHINPLLFQTSSNNFSADTASDTNRLNPISLANLDPFHDNDDRVPTRNPLMAAFERLRSPKQENFDYGTDQMAVFSTPYRQHIFAP